MKKSSTLAFAFLLLFTSMLCSANAQQPSQIVAAIESLKKQQVEIAENQTKLDEKLTDLSESIRITRLYMVRAGGNHKPLPIPK